MEEITVLPQEFTYKLDRTKVSEKALEVEEKEKEKAGKSIFSNSDLCTTNFRFVKGSGLYLRRR
ncbi:MAG: hypothetical protein LBC19_16845 [Tannerella sp.]|nr:hypothetical protein [Tannerella sp.]